MPTEVFTLAKEPADVVVGVAPQQSARPRLESVDFVRGLVIVIMALDHVRDFFWEGLFVPPRGIDPVNLAQTWPFLFFTRWITHFCAPTFVFLAGTGIFLYGSRGRSKGQMAWYLVSRGLWLIFLDLTVVRFAWSFYPDPHGFGGGPFFAIGASMILLAPLVVLPAAAVGALGVSIVAFHNLLDGLDPADLGVPKWLWMILHQPGDFPVFPQYLDKVTFGTAYCVLPWFGVVCCGYVLGAFYRMDQAERRRQLVGLGATLVLLFIGLRFANVYGDPPAPTPVETGRWSPQEKPGYTLLSFLNCQKYPPSLLFTLMTLGPIIVLLGLVDRPLGKLGRFFIAFGRVPLFFYVLHFYLIHGLMIGLDYLRFGKTPFLGIPPWLRKPEMAYEGYGYGLPVIYLVWVGVVLGLFPLCWWFANLKQRSRAAWLTYL